MAHLADYLHNLLNNSLEVPEPEIQASLDKAMEVVIEPRFAGGAREYQHAKRACRHVTLVPRQGGAPPAC